MSGEKQLFIAIKPFLHQDGFKEIIEYERKFEESLAVVHPKKYEYIQQNRPYRFFMKYAKINELRNLDVYNQPDSAELAGEMSDIHEVRGSLETQFPSLPAFCRSV